MTFTKEEIEREKLMVDYYDGWQYEDDTKTVSVKFYGFEDWLRKFCGLKDDYGDDWIDCYATIDPVKGVVKEIYMNFVSNCDEPDREVWFKITNVSEGKQLLDNMLKNDNNGGFTRFIREAKEEYTK